MIDKTKVIYQNRPTTVKNLKKILAECDDNELVVLTSNEEAGLIIATKENLEKGDVFIVMEVD